MKRLAILLFVAAASQAHAQMDAALAEYTAHHYEEALKIYRVEAERGFGQANFMLALMYSNGEGVQRNAATAIAYATKAADAGSQEAISIIADLYASDLSGVKDLAKAIDWYRKGVALKDTNSMRRLSKLYLNGNGVPQDSARAFALIKDAADRNDVLSMHELGIMYETGQGVAKDGEKARSWYLAMQRPRFGERVSGNGDPNLYVRLANLMEKTPHSSRDLETALALFEQAATVGNGDAMYRLGAMHEAGHGVAQDYAQAAAWYERAADSGNADGMYRGGLLIARGRGVKQSEAEAMNWFIDAAKHGHAVAMRRIAHNYDQGGAVEVDHASAKNWYCNGALADAASLRAMAVTTLMPETDDGKVVTAQLAILEQCRAETSQDGTTARQLRAELAAKLGPGVLTQAANLSSQLKQAHNISTVLDGFAKLDSE